MAKPWIPKTESPFILWSGSRKLQLSYQGRIGYQIRDLKIAATFVLKKPIYQANVKKMQYLLRKRRDRYEKSFSVCYNNLDFSII